MQSNSYTDLLVTYEYEEIIDYSLLIPLHSYASLDVHSLSTKI